MFRGHTQELFARETQLAARRLAHLGYAPVRVEPDHVVGHVVERILGALQLLLGRLALGDVTAERALVVDALEGHEADADLHRDLSAALRAVPCREDERVTLFEGTPDRDSSCLDLSKSVGVQRRVDVEDGHAQQLVARVLQVPAGRFAHLEYLPAGSHPDRVVGDAVEGVLGEPEPLLGPPALGDVTSEVDPQPPTFQLDEGMRDLDGVLSGRPSPRA